MRSSVAEVAIPHKGANASVFSAAALGVVMLGTVLDRLAGWEEAGALAGAALVVYLAREFPRLTRKGRVLLSIMLAVAAVMASLIGDPLDAAASGLAKACFYASFFAAIGFLRDAAETAPLIRRCGNHLIAQPPGRRYLALTSGTHLFSVILSFGAVELIGAMVKRSNTLASADGDERVQRVRERGMMLAILRGFACSTNWSPLAIMLVVVLSALPMLTWRQVVPMGLVFALVIMLLGWVMDRLDAERRATRMRGRRPVSRERWTIHLRLLALVLAIFAVAAILEAALEMHLIVAVTMTVPVISLAWIFAQHLRFRIERATVLTLRRARRHVLGLFPEHRMEIVILGGAGFAGTMVAAGIAPEAVAAAFALFDPPPVLVAIVVMWLILAAGQIGLNPVISVTVLGAALGDPAGFGLQPMVLALAYMTGWSLATHASPFVAVALIIGRLTGNDAWTVSSRWNGPFAMTGGAVASLGLVALDWLVRASGSAPL
jgi:hypothetical protein